MVWIWRSAPLFKARDNPFAAVPCGRPATAAVFPDGTDGFYATASALRLMCGDRGCAAFHFAIIFRARWAAGCSQRPFYLADPPVIRRNHLQKKGGQTARPECVSALPCLGFQHRHDLECPRIHDHDLVADQEVLIASPLRIDRHDLRRKGMEAYFARNAGSDRDREVHILDRFDMLFPDHAGDLGSLLGRELRASAGLTGGSLGPRFNTVAPFSIHVTAATFAAFNVLVAITVFAALGVLVDVATFATFGLHILATFATFRLHILAVFTAFSLHVLAVLAAFSLHVLAVLLAFRLHVLVGALSTVVVRTHAVGLLAACLVGAFILAGRSRFLLGLGGLHAGRTARFIAALFGCRAAAG